ncbi:MAG: hypothetical protein L6R35_006150 [Caloplaca aegaea]|nr:MAG: hypothetical protein L6R35_006150 [Caloplaca aegaea]
MLDPIIALGLASNVVQLVDFTTKVLRKGSRKGSKQDLVDHARLTVITSDLRNQTENLKSSLFFRETSIETDENGKALRDVADQCVDAADELRTRLSRLEPQAGRNPWTSLRQAVISVWSKEEVNEMVSRLDTYRSELAFQTLVVLSEKIGGHMKNHGQRFDRLEHKDDDIVEAISISQKRSARQAATYHQQTREHLREVTAAILTHRDGQTTTISQPMQEHTSCSLTDEGDSRHCMTLQTVRPSDNDDKASTNATASLSDFTIIQRRVLEYLSFSKIRDRVDEVARAHQSTFEWINHTPKPTQRPWSNLSEWMRKGEGCYWINGKAGSGKSTLMKYLFDNDTVKGALSEWAGTARLVVASYFSWNLGSPLQKSQVGLLRSLLHDILDQVPDLIPTVLPKLCRAASMRAHEELSSFELEDGLLRLAHQTDIPLKICLFVDGIDEFETDHSDIVRLFVSIPAAMCKVVVSSRPLPICFDAFDGCPSLRVQDLTHDDMRSYADTKVRTHKRWREFLEEEGWEAERIVDVLAEKAEGVFLWVVLAVASLLEGLRNYDRLSDFQIRLESLPPDLENLYSHMLNKMQPLYLRQASQLLQILHQHTELEADQPLSALQLSFADEEDPECALSHGIGELPKVLQISKCKALEGRLRSRCCGLMEIWQDWRLKEDDRFLKSRVIFLHRTVVEFLRNPTVISDLRLHTTAIGFNANIALAKGFLIDVKTQCQEHNLDNIIQSPAWQSMRRCLLFCRISEDDTSQRTELIIDELDKAMKARWTTINSVDMGPQGRNQDLSSSLPEFDWTTAELQRPSCLGGFEGFDSSQASIFVLAATLGLRQYIFYRCTTDPSQMESAQVQQAMRATVFRASCLMKDYFNPQSGYLSGMPKGKGQVSQRTYNCITDDLLAVGADPNHSLNAAGYSPWAFALYFTEAMPINTKTLEWCCMLSSFLAFGANPNESIKQEGRYLVRHRTVLTMLTAKISDHLARQKMREPVPDDKAIIGLARLQAMLIKEGAENREWTEITERKHQRDLTPAPWSSTDAYSSRSRVGNSQDNFIAKALSNVTHGRRGTTHTKPNDPKENDTSNSDSSSGEDEIFEYQNIKPRRHIGLTSSAEDCETDATEQSSRRGRSPTRDDTVLIDNGFRDELMPLAGKRAKAEQIPLGILSKIPEISQQTDYNTPSALPDSERLSTVSLPNLSPNDGHEVPESAAVDAINTSKARKRSLSTFFSSLFRHRRRRAR